MFSPRDFFFFFLFLNSSKKSILDLAALSHCHLICVVYNYDSWRSCFFKIIAATIRNVVAGDSIVFWEIVVTTYNTLFLALCSVKSLNCKLSLFSTICCYLCCTLLVLLSSNMTTMQRKRCLSTQIHRFKF